MRLVDVLTLTPLRTLAICQGKMEKDFGVHERAMPDSGRVGYRLFASDTIGATMSLAARLNSLRNSGSMRRKALIVSLTPTISVLTVAGIYL